VNVPLAIAAVAETVNVTAQRPEMPRRWRIPPPSSRAEIDAIHAENAERIGQRTRFHRRGDPRERVGAAVAFLL
jgi:hypothetical protein